ncbi:4-hydroxythreonine-4-phosphate dehydrogenase PdxA [Magnetovibrio sp. PR-2]|uniref:4-hydroxythreonine-4-phosphate dehydrogenase PdxA n=1 Tax=Magnetovibrio sp. PR-2 TaxID=3120356 RepID=UPI002FCE6034
MNKQPLAVTMGDPAGVGGEITLKAWLARSSQKLAPFFVLDDPGRLISLAKLLNLDVPIRRVETPTEAELHFDTALPVISLPLAVPPVLGTPSPENAKMTIGSIERAVELVLRGEASAVVTNPIAKEPLYDAGFTFPGHTEFLAHLGGLSTPPVMMLACDHLRVVLATVHVSILEAVQQLDGDKICEVARITHDALKRDFGIQNPTIAVAGLNPHAGEGGAMGREEIEIITPAVKTLQAQGINAMGPFPPDTMFTAKALPTFDAALCMYHDQGLIPLKTLDFERGVNTTLGLPFVRTSPDHGTAFDIAGHGKASPESLMAAMKMADDMATARALGED